MRRRWLIVVTSPVWMAVAIGTILAAQMFKADSKASRGRRPQ